MQWVVNGDRLRQIGATAGMSCSAGQPTNQSINQPATARPDTPPVCPCVLSCWCPLSPPSLLFFAAGAARHHRCVWAGHVVQYSAAADPRRRAPARHQARGGCRAGMLASYLFCRPAAGLLRRMGACCVLCNMLWRQHANICTPVSPACSFLAACLQCWAAHGHRHVLPAARPAGPEHDAPGGGGPAVRARTPTCTAVHLYLRPPFWPVPGVRAYACRSCRWILHCPSLTKTAGSCSLTKPLTMFPPASPPPAFRLMSPIALAENSPSCPRSGEGDLVLPNGTPWCRQLLMLLFTPKVLNEANGLLKPGGCQAGRQGWRGGEKREGDVGGWMGDIKQIYLYVA